MWLKVKDLAAQFFCLLSFRSPIFAFKDEWRLAVAEFRVVPDAGRFGA
jgi:hypothetical protein